MPAPSQYSEGVDSIMCEGFSNDNNNNKTLGSWTEKIDELYYVNNFIESDHTAEWATLIGLWPSRLSPVPPLYTPQKETIKNKRMGGLRIRSKSQKKSKEKKPSVPRVDLVTCIH